MTNPFAHIGERAIIQVETNDGRILRGGYLTQGGMHFVHLQGPDLPLIGHVEGPIDPDDVACVTVKLTRDQVLQEAQERLCGERFPGREPITRDDYEYRLYSLAKAIAQLDSERGILGRWSQLVRQLDALADRIRLSRPKRDWILREAKWSLRHNAPPTLSDLWIADVASPSVLRRPRAQDFDPDPAVRFRRSEVPAHVLEDPRSIRNVLSRLRAAGFNARITRLGDPEWERGTITVDFREACGGQRALFHLDATRLGDGFISWDVSADCGESSSGFRRAQRMSRTDRYLDMRMLVMGDALERAA